MDLLERLVWHHDQPFGDSSAIPTFLLSEVTRRHVTVALSGDGGDELFAGYERFAAGLAARRYAALPGVRPQGVRGALRDAAGASAARARREPAALRRVAALGLPDAYRAWISFVPDDERAALLDGASDDWAPRRLPRDLARDRRARARSTGCSTSTCAPTCSTTCWSKVDRMSMAHGLEVRSPFLDTELLEFAARLPPALKVRGLSLKRVLKARGRGPGPARDPRTAPSAGSACRSTAGSATTCAPTSARRSGAADARVKRAPWRPTPSTSCWPSTTRAARNHGHALWTLLTLEVFLGVRGGDALGAKHANCR